MKPSHLFHVTLGYNKHSIDLFGIDARIRFPERNPTAPNFFVTPPALGWAIAHTADRHHAHIEDLIVYRIETPPDARKFFGKGIYTICDRPVYVPVIDAPKSARFVLSAMQRNVPLTKPELFASFDIFEEVELD